MKGVDLVLPVARNGHHGDYERVIGSMEIHIECSTKEFWALKY